MARQTSWIVGSNPDCDVVVSHPTVSVRHCRLTRSTVGYVVEDLRSSNGTFVNGVRLAEPTAVSQQDRITLGRVVEMPWPEAAAAASQEARRGSHRSFEPTIPSRFREALDSQRGDEPAQVIVAIRGAAMELGRDPQSDCVLDYPMVSWRHARITRDGASLFVEDLKSSNGTFVNGERIRERTAVKPGDVIG